MAALKADLVLKNSLVSLGGEARVGVRLGVQVVDVVRGVPDVETNLHEVNLLEFEGIYNQRASEHLKTWGRALPWICCRSPSKSSRHARSFCRTSTRSMGGGTGSIPHRRSTFHAPNFVSGVLEWRRNPTRVKS